ncbi:MAG: hypothetical protein JHD23_04550 [Akkermansiaceae bacterium]|nr:hypothetical protein [Akkermansiaceae bacterium]
MRTLFSVTIGFIIGAIGAILFSQSMPPKEGSAEEQVSKLEVELKRANNRVSLLEQTGRNGKNLNRTLKDNVRNITEDIRDGRLVTPDDIFRASQPLIRDLVPLLDRVRARQVQRQSDARAGEIARKYSLTDAQLESLKILLAQNADAEAKRFTSMLSQEGTKLEDFAKATNNINIEDGLEQFMQNNLQGDQFVKFKADQMLEKVQKVQEEADMKVTRLDSIVKLDDSQHSEIFSVMARGARDFDPSMQIEGMSESKDSLSTGKSKQDAIFDILTPTQREAYDNHRNEKRSEAQKDMEAIGLRLPDDWNSSDLLDF